MLMSKVSLQSQIAGIKKHVRIIKRHCVSTEDEWNLNTCYGRCNRLKGAGVANKHAAMQGMPKIPNEDADKIMSVIQQMRGSIGSKKNKNDSWKERRHNSQSLTDEYLLAVSEK